MKLYTIKDVCQIFSIGKTTVYKLIKEGKLKFVKIADCTRFTGFDIQSFIESIRNKGGNA